MTHDALHLTAVTLDPGHPYTRTFITNADTQHDHVLASITGITEADTRQTHRVLHAVTYQDNQPRLIIHSATSINEAALRTRLEGAVQEFHNKTVHQPTWLVDGANVRYMITINTVHCRPGSASTKTRGKRTPVPPQQIPQWWEAKALHSAGMAINGDTLNITPPAIPITINRKPDGTAKKAKDRSGERTGQNLAVMSLTAARIVGTATISDATTTWTAITQGVGQGRAYGLGLLAVAPAR